MYSRVELEEVPVVTAVDVQEITLSRAALLLCSQRQATNPFDRVAW